VGGRQNTDAREVDVHQAVRGSDDFRPENSISWLVFNCHAADQHRARATGLLDAQWRPVFSQATDVKDEVSGEEVGSEDSAASSSYFQLVEVTQQSCFHRYTALGWSNTNPPI
jgi:hypothetical protein